MKNIRPCPECGGEVEVVRLKDKVEGKHHEKQYRIQCMRCHLLVAKGLKFPKETDEQGKERIAQYEQVLEQKFAKADTVKEYKYKNNNAMYHQV